MSTITKEWLQSQISAIEAVGITDSNTLEAFKLALASLEAEAVAFVMADDLKDSSIISTPAYRDLGEAMERTVGDVVALYAAPPAPVSVLDITALDNLAGEMLNHAMNCERRVAVAYTHCAHRLAEEVRDLRAAMLQGAENVKSRCTIQAAPALDSSPKIAESRCSNSSVVPDGYVLVPVEPTMSQEFAGYRTLTDTGKMSRLMKTRLSNIYRAMIAAAPQQEVSDGR
ncbi:hypothetical protein [Enterobacter cloacae complex sp. ESBL7]|uniref:hypothetical protein n=1 Tax=Enterobacter cloacae complex sp. ESBL7 TaxID=3163325 RepID=UPI003569FE05